MALARTWEALHKGWDKNDPRDAHEMLPMLRIGAAQCYLDPLIAGINDVQELSKTHEAIAKAKTEIQHRETPLGRWARGRLARAHKNVAVVALANKLVRIAWAILARGCAYNAGYEMVSA